MNPMHHCHILARFSPVNAGRGSRGPCHAALTFTVAALAFAAFYPGQALAGASLVVDLPSGSVLYEDHPTRPWYPASLTKLMTVYVALSAVRDHRIALETPIAVSARAASMAPSKMGFRPGTLVTLDNALKMLMVKSANDMAVTIAEGISGSVEAFADDMNAAARSIGMTQSHFVNPNGLPNPDHVSSARDLAILARALYLTFPEQAELFNIGALKLAGKVIRNHNDLLGRYPGADGMKTGFICASGFNIVASATQGGRKVIAVVLGAPNVRARAMMTATLFDRAFAGVDKPSKSLSDLTGSAPAAFDAAPPDDIQQMSCRSRGRAAAAYNEETERLMAPLLGGKASASPGQLILTTAGGLAKPAPIATRIGMVPAANFDPKPVYIGPPPGYGGLIAQARPPHSPVGTPQPPGSVTAYAPEMPDPSVAAIPLSADTAALPLKSKVKPNARQRSAHAKRNASHRHRVARAEASHAQETPKPHQKSVKAAHSPTVRGGKTAASKAAVKAHARTAPGAGANTNSQARTGGKATGKSEKHAKR
jgi:D-alanyl-D-alanine carboxypeptidase